MDIMKVVATVHCPHTITSLIKFQQIIMSENQLQMLKRQGKGINRKCCQTLWWHFGQHGFGRFYLGSVLIFKDHKDYRFILRGEAFAPYSPPTKKNKKNLASPQILKYSSLPSSHHSPSFPWICADLSRMPSSHSLWSYKTHSTFSFDGI